MRLLHQNTGGTNEKRDIANKLICNCCGKSFYICHSRRKGSAINSYPYYICATKKKHGSVMCDNNNIQMKKIDEFIDELCENYYKNIRLSNKAKVIKLQNELTRLKNRSLADIEKECQVIKSDNKRLEKQLSKLIDNFLDSSDIMKNIINKKIDDVESSIKRNNNMILDLNRAKINVDADKLVIEKKIRAIKKELTNTDDVTLTREELMERIKAIRVDKGMKLIVEYI